MVNSIPPHFAQNVALNAIHFTKLRLKSAKSVLKKRLRLDSWSIKELFETKQVTSLNWCDANKQLAYS